MNYTEITIVQHNVLALSSSRRLHPVCFMYSNPLQYISDICYTLLYARQLKFYNLQEVRHIKVQLASVSRLKNTLDFGWIDALRVT